MYIQIDTELCAGCGECKEAFPDFFTIGRYTAVPKKQHVSWESAAELLQAVENCPAEAIQLLPEQIIQNSNSKFTL